MQSSLSRARLSLRAPSRALLVIAGAAALALAAQVRIPLPFSPVPITLQTLVVLALAGLLGRSSTLSVIAYLALTNSWMRLAGPTGGYLLGFLLAAYAAGWLAEGAHARPLRLFLALLLGQAAIYACGLFWLSRFVPAAALLPAGLYPFLPGDACKLALSFLITLPARGAGSRP